MIESARYIDTEEIKNENLINKKTKKINTQTKEIMILIIISLIIIFISSISEKEEIVIDSLTKENVDISMSIEAVDNTGLNTAQINWKQVYAIALVINNNDINKIDANEISSIAKMFIDNNNLKSLEKVIDELNISKSKTNEVYRYIDKLKYVGITPDKLKQDSEYMKFINSIKEGAIKNYNKYKILPSITIAQAILESGWGKSDLANNHNNLFGIKAHSYWTGDTVVVQTKEYFDTFIEDVFRKYENKTDSILDQGKFLSENPRYTKHGVFESNTYTHQAQALEDAGYSTHVNEKGEKIYAEQLIQIIRQYDLQLIDNEVQLSINQK